MPLRCYVPTNFGPDRLAMIVKVNQLITDYKKQGYSLTLRQVYYQFVARDWLPQSWASKETGSINNERSYKRLGLIVNDGRLAGKIDWHAIEDRTREVDGNSHWDDPQSIINACATSYLTDKWEDQPHRVEVWVEKDALEGVVGKTAKALDVQFFSCRGYTSQTAMWDAGQRLKAYAVGGQDPVILHLGDHDPSGIDMSRDVEDRLRQLMDGYGDQLTFKRIALNADQIAQYNPPPNPTKMTDARANKYVEEHGTECWELDALDPRVIDKLVRDEIIKHRDEDLYNAKFAEQAEDAKLLTKTARRWDEVVSFLED